MARTCSTCTRRRRRPPTALVAATARASSRRSATGTSRTARTTTTPATARRTPSRSGRPRIRSTRDGSTSARSACPRPTSTPCGPRSPLRSSAPSTRPRPHRTRGPRISSSTCTRRKASRAGPARSRVPRAALAALVLLAGACAAPPPSAASPTPSPTREPGTYAVTALLDLSGTRGPRGDAQRNAMQQWADAQRGTPRIRLRITDVGGSDAKLLVELKRAADAGDADAFVVGVPATIDDALSSAIALVKRPVLFTLPIAEPGGDGARWIFGLAPAPEAVARALVDALPAHSTPAVVVTNGTLVAGREEQALT